MNEIINTDNQFSKIKNINIGSHNHLLNIIFGDCINEFYMEYANVNLNLVNEETDKMIKMLKNKELDLVFSKKVDDKEDSDIKFISLGVLHDVFIVGKDSDLSNNVLTKADLKNETIYVPRVYAQTVNRLKSLMENEELNLKNSSYNTILQLVSLGRGIGLITREYIKKEEFKKYNLKEVQSELNMQPVEFGMYVNNSSFRELNNLIKIIKDYFK